MSEGIDGDIVLVGFPYDEGVVRNGGRRGAELGPCCLRRFLPKTGPLYNVEHQISIDSLRFSDYLNIQPAEETMDAAYEKLRTKLLTIFGKT
jgi:formiminoglutamase